MREERPKMPAELWLWAQETHRLLFFCLRDTVFKYFLNWSNCFNNNGWNILVKMMHQFGEIHSDSHVDAVAAEDPNAGHRGRKADFKCSQASGTNHSSLTTLDLTNMHKNRLDSRTRGAHSGDGNNNEDTATSRIKSGLKYTSGVETVWKHRWTKCH